MLKKTNKRLFACECYTYLCLQGFEHEPHKLVQIWNAMTGTVITRVVFFTLKLTWFSEQLRTIRAVLYCMELQSGGVSTIQGEIHAKLMIKIGSCGCAVPTRLALH